MFTKKKKVKKIYCVHCLYEVHERVDGGKCIIPLALSGRFTEEVVLHDKCLKSYLAELERNRQAFRKVGVKFNGIAI